MPMMTDGHRIFISRAAKLIPTAKASILVATDNTTKVRPLVGSPVDFLGFLQLENNARLVLTDSGGVQEETCIMGIPCVTLRDNTERPETIEVGSNILAGTLPDDILRCTRMMLEKKNSWINPFGDGNSGKKITQILMEESND